MKAKRSLGQNFFINKNLGERIVSYIPEGKTVVEIGPGRGFFTELLKDRFENIILIEKDKELSDSLSILYPDIQIFNEDFLSFDFRKLPSKDIVFFGSLPYNVSKPIMRMILESEYFTNPGHFIVQKEVAEKYIYRKPFNVLSLTTAIYADVKKLIDIKPDSFRPRPNVNSSLIQVTPVDRDIENKELLQSVITTAFKQPRKNLKNNFKNTKFENLSNSYSEKRAADLSLDEYIGMLKIS